MTADGLCTVFIHQQEIIAVIPGSGQCHSAFQSDCIHCLDPAVGRADTDPDRICADAGNIACTYIKKVMIPDGIQILPAKVLYIPFGECTEIDADMTPAFFRDTQRNRTGCFIYAELIINRIR